MRRQGESPKFEGPVKTHRQIQKQNLRDFDTGPFLSSININKEEQHQPNPEPST